jgi:hypothetical protein
MEMHKDLKFLAIPFLEIWEVQVNSKGNIFSTWVPNVMMNSKC